MFLKGIKPLVLIGLCVFGLTAHAANKPLQVLATIKPLALIAAAITGPDVEIDTLLPASATPHHFTLRVSDMRRIEQADLVLWIGPEFETVLQKSLSTQQTLTASTLSDLVWPAAMNEHHDHQHGHDHGGKDWHLWLNPQNAAVIAQAIANELSAKLPAKAAIFQARAAAFQENINTLAQKLQALLEPVKDQQLAVYHDAYRHYMEQFGLTQVAHFTTTDEQPLGAKHKYEMERQLEQGQCILVNPIEDMPKAGEYAKKASLKVALVDPLGRDADTYDELMLAITKAILACHLVV